MAALAGLGRGRKREHDIRAIKRNDFDALRGGEICKGAHAEFLCLAHNQLILLHRQIVGEENVEDGPERKRKARRKLEASAAGRKSRHAGTRALRLTHPASASSTRRASR